MTIKWMLFPLLLSILLQIYHTQSCSTLTRDGVSLTGVCPNDTKLIPVGGTATYQCEYDRSGSAPNVLIFWNITGFDSFLSISPPVSQTICISSTVTGNTGLSVVTINSEPVINTTMDISCGVCVGSHCSTSPTNPLIITDPVQLIIFGK